VEQGQAPQAIDRPRPHEGPRAADALAEKVGEHRCVTRLDRDPGHGLTHVKARHTGRNVGESVCESVRVVAGEIGSICQVAAKQPPCAVARPWIRGSDQVDGFGQDGIIGRMRRLERLEDGDALAVVVGEQQMELHAPILQSGRPCLHPRHTMLLKQATLRSILDGSISLVFRRWKRPTVRSGGTLTTSMGVLAIESLDRIEESEISEDDGRAAGFPSRAELLEALTRGTGDVYRIVVRPAGPDPRVALRTALPSTDEVDTILSRLARWDRASTTGAWTDEALRAIEAAPGTRAADLAHGVGQDKARFKSRIRKLKGLGLTESLKVGYMLSPRGRAVLGLEVILGDGASSVGEGR